MRRSTRKLACCLSGWRRFSELRILAATIQGSRPSIGREEEEGEEEEEEELGISAYAGGGLPDRVSWGKEAEVGNGFSSFQTSLPAYPARGTATATRERQRDRETEIHTHTYLDARATAMATALPSRGSAGVPRDNAELLSVHFA